MERPFDFYGEVVEFCFWVSVSYLLIKVFLYIEINYCGPGPGPTFLWQTCVVDIFPNKFEPSP